MGMSTGEVYTEI
ncbi:hypothetical protein G4B88_010777 [Cannabis sativa]|uniref:Uncharacterized protein n=1 Tax=Cannabis sativa TaxID=3483 RepID=A0A7J6DQN6_CANSA|nr:hypothetical protein G4B88_010777 [Cannabis sativa]